MWHILRQNDICLKDKKTWSSDTAFKMWICPMLKGSKAPKILSKNMIFTIQIFSDMVWQPFSCEKYPWDREYPQKGGIQLWKVSMRLGVPPTVGRFCTSFQLILWNLFSRSLMQNNEKKTDIFNFKLREWEENDLLIACAISFTASERKTHSVPISSCFHHRNAAAVPQDNTTAILQQQTRKRNAKTRSHQAVVHMTAPKTKVHCAGTFFLPTRDHSILIIFTEKQCSCQSLNKMNNQAGYYNELCCLYSPQNIKMDRMTWNIFETSQ